MSDSRDVSVYFAYDINDIDTDLDMLNKLMRCDYKKYNSNAECSYKDYLEHDHNERLFEINGIIYCFNCLRSHFLNLH